DANLMSASLDRTKLHGTSFLGAHLFRANLTKIDVDDATVMKEAILTQAYIREARRPNGTGWAGRPDPRRGERLGRGSRGRGLVLRRALGRSAGEGAFRGRAAPGGEPQGVDPHGLRPRRRRPLGGGPHTHGRDARLARRREAPRGQP